MSTDQPATSSLELPPCDHTPLPYDGPPREEVIALRRQYVSPGVLAYYKEPLVIVEGHMQYLWDEAGRRYLDGFAGIVSVSVGHCHPDVISKVQEQTGRLQHTTTIYMHPNIGQYGKKMAQHMPSGSELSMTYFTNSGSEANEIAILSAREFTGNRDVISLRNAYHGGTGMTIGLTAHGNWKFKSNLAVDIKNATPGYCYRCPYGLEYPSCEMKCAHDVAERIRYETSGEIACFIGEPIQGVGGAVTPPPEYFKIVYDAVREHGGLCIADEVQTGFGRTGEHFWGFENWGVTPDIVTMAKGMGNGAPIGACVTRPEIAQVMARRLHFNTFGGNPVSMAQGMATLDVIDSANIQENARVVGGHLRSRLDELSERHDVIGDIRGMGLMLGVELVNDRVTREPGSAAAATVLELARERGLLLGKGGIYGNVLRIKPPMCLTRDDADFIADCLDESFGLLQR